MKRLLIHRSYADGESIQLAVNFIVTATSIAGAVIYVIGCYYYYDFFFFLLIHRSYADGESIQLAVILIIIIITSSSSSSYFSATVSS